MFCNSSCCHREYCSVAAVLIDFFLSVAVFFYLEIRCIHSGAAEVAANAFFSGFPPSGGRLYI